MACIKLQYTLEEQTMTDFNYSSHAEVLIAMLQEMGLEPSTIISVFMAGQLMIINTLPTEEGKIEAHKELVRILQGSVKVLVKEEEKQ